MGAGLYAKLKFPGIR